MLYFSLSLTEYLKKHIFTDNGGQTKSGGNNWPLRGNKGTLWEGGVKAVGFIHGKRLRLTQPGMINNQLMHVSDWFPTIMSATGCSILNGTQNLDGYDQWETLRQVSFIILLLEHNVLK